MNHAQTRAKERFGLDLSADDLSAIVSIIERGGAVLVRRCGAGARLYRVAWDGLDLPVVYAPTIRRIMTVYPEFKARRHDPRWFKQFDECDMLSSEAPEVPLPEFDPPFNSIIADQLKQIFGEV